MNVDLYNPNNLKWSVFNYNILKRAVKEINEKTDIYVTYEPIKEKDKNNRKTVTKILFNIEKQSEEHLKKIGLIEEQEIDPHELQLKAKSKAKLDKLIKNGYKVSDEDAWIKADITKNKDKYEAEIELDYAMMKIKDFNEDEYQYYFKNLAKYLDQEDFVIIENYLIKNMYGEFVTTNPIDTLSILKKYEEDTILD